MKEFLKIIKNKKDPKYKEGCFFRSIAPGELLEILSIIDEREHKFSTSAMLYYMSNDDCTLEIKLRFQNRVWLVFVKTKNEWFVFENIHDAAKSKILKRCDGFYDVLEYLKLFTQN